MPRKSPARVIVITGASSGVGRALALEFALAHDALVLGSRREESLEIVRRDCEALRTMAISRVTDLASQADAYALANAALARFKRVDVWINCAPPLVQRDGSENSSLDIDAELKSYDHGATAALACFELLKRGVLINVDATSGSATPGSAEQRELKRRVCEMFSRIEERAKAVPGIRVTSLQCPRHTIASEALAPMIVSLAHSMSKPGVIGRVRSIAERGRVGVLLRTMRHQRRRTRAVQPARDAR
jgi:NAD(P)-dependent dehydrogenase (short-subunit alcohol dehydrogenase family)